MKEPDQKLIEAARARGIDESQLRSFFSDVGNMSRVEALRYIAGIANATAALVKARAITDELGSFEDVDAGPAERDIIFAGRERRGKGRKIPDPVGDFVQRRLDAKKTNE